MPEDPFANRKGSHLSTGGTSSGKSQYYDYERQGGAGDFNPFMMDDNDFVN